jgi:O-glycosyl hydrolase
MERDELVTRRASWWGVGVLGLGLGLGVTGCRTMAEPGGAQPDVLEVTLRPGDARQTIRSFGASDAWSLQFVGREWPVEKRERIADLLFSLDLRPDGSPEGIGLSGWRFNLGAGSADQGAESGIRDEWRRAESFLLPDGSWDWSRLAGQRWFLRAAKQRGVEEFVGFVNSPPVAITRNGRAHSSGGDSSNLAPERYRELANYLRDVTVQLERTEGVSLDYISPVNEPQWDWDGGQEGSPWLNREVRDVVAEIGRSLHEAGLDTRVEIPEAGKLNYLYEDADRPGRGSQAEAFFSRSSPLRVADLPGVARSIAGHSYYTTYPTASLVETRSRLRERLRSVDPELELRMTEYCVLEDNPEIRGRGRDLGMTTALYVARVIHADLTIAEASSWSWWIAVSPYDYKDGLVYIDHDRSDGSIYESKLLWALGHYSRFIRPGMERIEVDRSDGLSAAGAIDRVLLSAYRHPDSGETVVVAVNQTTAEARVRVRGGGATEYRVYLTTEAAGDDLRQVGRQDAARALVLPPRSITTLVAGRS